jgi:hypothetical protein
MLSGRVLEQQRRAGVDDGGERDLQNAQPAVPMFTKVTVTDGGVAPDPPLTLTGANTIVPVPLQDAVTGSGTAVVV